MGSRSPAGNNPEISGSDGGLMILEMKQAGLSGAASDCWSRRAGPGRDNPPGSMPSMRPPGPPGNVRRFHAWRERSSLAAFNPSDLLRAGRTGVKSTHQ